MWAVVSASVVGTSHETNSTPCQDSCHFIRSRIGTDDVLLAAVSDGAGSASHSKLGSSEAVQHLLKLVSQEEIDLAAISEEQVRRWYGSVLDHLVNVGQRESVAVGDLACTLLLAIAWRNGAVFAQVGDGAWIIERKGQLVAGTWPETGEYANVTVFLTTKNALVPSPQGEIQHLQFRRLDGPIDAVAGFTDGLQALALDYGRQVPFERFFMTMFTPLRAASDETQLIEPLEQLLASEVITSRTDDDKTLLLGVWREPIDEPAPNASAE